jgi:hypothetical protein
MVMMMIMTMMMMEEGVGAGLETFKIGFDEREDQVSNRIHQLDG